MSDEAFPILVVEDLGDAALLRAARVSLRYQFPQEGEPGFITIARGPPTIGFGVRPPSARGPPVGPRSVAAWTPLSSGAPPHRLRGCAPASTATSATG
jgi:hypothetical protein